MFFFAAGVFLLRVRRVVFLLQVRGHVFYLLRVRGRVFFFCCGCGTFLLFSLYFFYENLYFLYI